MRLGLALRAGLVILSVAFLTLMVLAPVLRLFSEDLGEPAAWALPWHDGYLRARVLWTFAQAAFTCLLALGLGLPLAWVLARFEFPGRTLVLRGLMLPFVVPTLVGALGVLALWGPRGGLGQALAAVGVESTQGPWLLLCGNLFFNLSLLVRAGVDALEQVSATQLAAARTLGASPWRAFWRVQWPTMTPWLAGALCLIFLYCLTGFGLALVLGGPQYATAEVEIYTLVAHELELNQARVLAVWMLLLTTALTLAYVWLQKRLAAPRSAAPIARLRPQNLAQWAAVVVALTLWALICAAPLLAVIAQAIHALLWGQGMAALREPQTWQALWNTLRFSALALLAATVLGIAHALAARGSHFGPPLLRKPRRRWGPLRADTLAVCWRALALLPLVASPVSLAFGLLLVYPAHMASLGLLVALYALLAYPFVAHALDAALDALPTHYAQAAATLGASPWRVFSRVTLPLVGGSLRRGMAFAAATAMGEFAVSLFLARPEWVTLTTLIYQHLGRPGAAHHDAALVLSCLLMALAWLVFSALSPPCASEGQRHA